MEQKPKYKYEFYEEMPNMRPRKWDTTSPVVAGEYIDSITDDACGESTIIIKKKNNV